MHRRTFLQSLCVLAASLAVGHTPQRPITIVLVDTFRTEGWGAAYHLQAGDIFTIAGHYQTNPPTRCGMLQQFRVLFVNPNDYTITLRQV